MLLGWILDGRKTWSMCFTTVSVPQVGFCAHLLNQKAMWDPLPLGSETSALGERTHQNLSERCWTSRSLMGTEQARNDMDSSLGLQR